MKHKLKGTMIATAAATLLLQGGCIRILPAGDKEGPPGSLNPPLAGPVKCYGANECKGQGACANKSHDCAGKNECKGKGWMNKPSAQECLNIGGSTQPPTARPPVTPPPTGPVKCEGLNECKGRGACASKSHDCAGRNECKGKGWIQLTAKECSDRGGKISG